MPILYALVARGTVVLTEFSVGGGNAGAVARRILEKVAESEGERRVSYTQDRYVFHIEQADGLLYLCMADAQFGRRIPFAFLDDIRTRFLRTYGLVVQTALAYAMNDEFGRVLSQQIEYFSTNPTSDAITRVKGEISEVRAVMVENIDKVLDRGGRIELLVDRTTGLSDNTFRFKKQAKGLQQALWWKNAKLVGLLGVGFGVAIYILISVVCGGLLLPTCRA